MMLDKKQLEQIEKIASKIEQKLEAPLTQEDISELNIEVKQVLAELGQYNRFFKRLI